MLLSAAIDALFAEAQAAGARPFRLDLQEAQIDRLRDEGVLVAPEATMDSSRGSYREVRIYPAGRVSELLAQPLEDVRAVRLPLR